MTRIVGPLLTYVYITLSNPQTLKEPSKCVRVCQIDVNSKSQKHSPQQFILFEIF